MSNNQDMIGNAAAMREALKNLVDVIDRCASSSPLWCHNGAQGVIPLKKCESLKAVGLPRLPDGRYIDIRLRMLKPSELAAAHSFPKDYILTGNRGDQVKQIGNSVPVMTAKAMCEVDFKELG